MTHRRWRCRWIWAGGDPAAAASLDLLGGSPPFGREEDVLLRRRFTLAAVPARAPVRVTADSRYALFVNGVEVLRGPVRGEPSKLTYDTLDLAPLLHAGENVLALRARYYGTPTTAWVPARPTLNFGRQGAVALELDLGSEAIGTGAGWKALRPEAWTPVARRGVSLLPIEHCDGRRLPAGWSEPDFDDSAWPPAAELRPLALGAAPDPSPPTAPYGALRPRPIALLEGETREARPLATWHVAAGDEGAAADPIDAAHADEARAATAPKRDAVAFPLELAFAPETALVLVDFGEIVAGLVGIEVEAEPGVTVDLAAREVAERDASFGGGAHAGFRYVTRGARDAFESFDPIGLRYALLAVRGATKPVVLRRVWCRERLYPERGDAFFASSDPLLDRIYRVGRRTVTLNAHDAYLDCPTREQRGWVGDSVVHQMVHLTTNADWGLARWHAQLANAPRADGMLPMAAAGDLTEVAVTIPEWALGWVRSLWNLWRYTGDRELIQGQLPGAENVLRWFLPYRGDDGLVRHVDQWVLVDWAALHHADTSASLNAQWARALVEFAEMSEWLGDAGRAAWARGLHAELRRAFELFWDESRGSYVDHAVEGVPQRPMSQHAGATALWAGLVPGPRVPRVLATLTDRARLVRRTWIHATGPGYLVTGPGKPDWDVERQIVAAEPFYRYVVHDAVAAAGRADLIPELCRDWAGFLERGETSWPEMWSEGTHCHGWSSTPTRDLVQHVLGITPAEPGFAVARVAPRLGDLEWVRGAAPTPYGSVRVEASRDRVTVESPVPVLLDLAGRAPERLPAGRHERKTA
jgi:hypothetical protein